MQVKRSGVLHLLPPLRAGRAAVGLCELVTRHRDNARLWTSPHPHHPLLRIRENDSVFHAATLGNRCRLV